MRSTRFACTFANQYRGRTANTRHLLRNTNPRAGSGDSIAHTTASIATAKPTFRATYTSSLMIERRLDDFKNSILSLLYHYCCEVVALPTITTKLVPSATATGEAVVLTATL